MRGVHRVAKVCPLNIPRATSMQIDSSNAPNVFKWRVYLKRADLDKHAPIAGAAAAGCTEDGPDLEWIRDRGGEKKRGGTRTASSVGISSTCDNIDLSRWSR